MVIYESTIPSLLFTFPIHTGEKDFTFLRMQ
jgi:hypothetical protein